MQESCPRCCGAGTRRVARRQHASGSTNDAAKQAEIGVTFNVGGLIVEPIREELEYGGLRLKTHATIDEARIRVVVDVGFGDAVEPTEMDLPVLLDLPAPRLRASSRLKGVAVSLRFCSCSAAISPPTRPSRQTWIRKCAADCRPSSAR